MSKLKVYCDFDGTITIQDTWLSIGDVFIREKEKWHELISKFENLKIGARECFLGEISLIENFDFTIFNEIIDRQELDKHFEEFVDFCQKNNLPLTILSEGMDYYISRVLKNNKLNIPFYTNHFVLSDDRKRFHLEFPHSDSECEKCGCCKRNLILNMTADDEISVYIGDGFSDACAAHYADIVFAKKSLASYCWKNNITYFEYKDFSDVTNKMEKLLTKKNLKHRQTASLKRKEVFLRG